MKKKQNFLKSEKIRDLERIAIVSLFFLLQISFLFAILSESLGSPLKIILIVGVAFFISLVFSKIIRKKHAHGIGNPILILYVVLGAVLTYFMSTETDLGPVISAAAVGFAVSFFPKRKKTSKLYQMAPAVYCGAFVGMCSTSVANNFWFILFAALISGLIYIFSSGTMIGFGGKLGTIAFGGVCLASLFIFIFL